MIIKPLSFILLLILMLPLPINANNLDPWVGMDLNKMPCNSHHYQRHHFGPFDYTIYDHRAKFKVVEDYHFTPEVKNLISGSTSWKVSGDLIYTLRAVPNHHEALLTLIRYQLNLNKKLATKNTIEPLEMPVECFFQRAIHFSPKDAVTISLYAYYLKNIGHLENAADLYEKALVVDPDNAKIQYSYGQLLIQMKDYDKATVHAKKAYELGKPPQGLKNQLEKLGKW